MVQHVEERVLATVGTHTEAWRSVIFLFPVHLILKHVMGAEESATPSRYFQYQYLPCTNSDSENNFFV